MAGFPLQVNRTGIPTNWTAEINSSMIPYLGLKVFMSLFMFIYILELVLLFAHSFIHQSSCVISQCNYTVIGELLNFCASAAFVQVEQSYRELFGFWIWVLQVLWSTMRGVFCIFTPNFRGSRSIAIFSFQLGNTTFHFKKILLNIMEWSFASRDIPSTSATSLKCHRWITGYPQDH